MLDNRSPLMKRLAEIMPKKPEPKWEPNKLMLSIDYQPIRVAAESFRIVDGRRASCEP